jgi:hypothetical protein
MLTQWEIELRMLEDWLDNPEPTDGCQKTVMQISGEENSTELLKIFSQEAEQEMTATLEPAAEEEADNIDFVELHEELETLERSRHIQQAKLETDGGAYQPGEKLKEVGDMPVGELTEAKVCQKEETEQQLSDGTAELEFVAEWQAKCHKGKKDSMGDQVDLPTDKAAEKTA